MPILVVALAFAINVWGVDSRTDGLALTPPMGWSSWYAFGANINETKIVEMADAIVHSGLRDAGYHYVNLDDAWMSPMRDRHGRLTGDPTRFPSGMKWLADQMHSRGLKLGLYGCPGVRTCLGFPGQFEHEYQDAETIAGWGVDWWKHDNCFQKWATVDTYSTALSNGSYPNTEATIAKFLNDQSYGLNIRGLSTQGQDANPINFQNISGLPLATPDPGQIFTGDTRGFQIQYYEAYRLFAEALQSTGRNITLSICPLIAGCDESVWNYYKPYVHLSMNQCIQHDNTDRWDSFTWHIDDNNNFPERAHAASPGYWNDLDFLMIGYKELKAWEPRQTLQEYRSQYSLFCILAAPLIFSADIRGTDPKTNAWSTEMSSILLNDEMIAVSQDPLGVQGQLTKALPSGIELYTRKLHDGSLALAALNRASANITNLLCRWSDVGILPSQTVQRVRNVWERNDVPHTRDGIEVTWLLSHDTAVFRVWLS